MEHKAQYLSNLTPLRGIAAILVAVFHFEMAVARFVPAQKTMFFEKSYLMVDLFFIMSGFIMLHVYKDNFSSAFSNNNFRKFIVARFARIYPLHFFSLSLLVILVIIFSPPGTYPNAIENPATIPTGFLLLNAYYIHNIYTWNIPSWSISAEWAAYLLFPFLAVFINRKNAVAVILLLFFIISAYLSIMFLLSRKNPLYPMVPVPHNLNTTYDYGFLRGIAGFISGMILYKAYERPAIRIIFQKDTLTVIIIVLLIASLNFAFNDLLCVILFAAVVLGFACNNNHIHRLCNNRIAQYTGRVSYSIYLMQIFLQEPFSKGLRLPGVTGLGRGKQNIAFAPGLMYCLVYLAMLIAISSVTYYLIEQPCRKFINRKWGA